jgi:hypothetical protein
MEPFGTIDPEYGVTAKKYGVSISFCRKQTIFSKTMGYDLWILSENLNFLKPIITHIWDH